MRLWIQEGRIAREVRRSGLPLQRFDESESMAALARELRYTHGFSACSTPRWGMATFRAARGQGWWHARRRPTRPPTSASVPTPRPCWCASGPAPTTPTTSALLCLALPFVLTSWQVLHPVPATTSWAFVHPGRRGQACNTPHRLHEMPGRCKQH